MIAQKIENTTQRYKNLRKILGKNNIRTEIESPFDFIAIASKGVSADTIKNFMAGFHLSQTTAADFLNISTPTLYRWLKTNKKLDLNYSVKLFEIAEVFLYGYEVFQNKENFSKWLNLPNTALGGMEPIKLLEIPNGVSKVRDIIGRIEHGIYS